jgi:N-acetyl-anhydromuramyl-L-alanine amidase AmpD
MSSDPFKTGEPRLLKTGAVAPAIKSSANQSPAAVKKSAPVPALATPWVYPKAKMVPDKDTSKSELKPQGVVIHYTVSDNLDATVDFFQKNEVDIHFLIGKDGATVQMVPCNRQAAHAGESAWGNLKFLNQYFLGIEVVCLGPIQRLKSGAFVDGYDRPYKGTPRDKLMLGNRFWDPFTSAQEKALDDLIRWMLQTYKFPVGNIVGHHEIAPTRKIDPGGSLSLDMDAYRKKFMTVS